MLKNLTTIGAVLTASTILHAQDWERTGDVIYSTAMIQSGDFGPHGFRFWATGAGGSGSIQYLAGLNHYPENSEDRLRPVFVVLPEGAASFPMETPAGHILRASAAGIDESVAPGLTAGYEIQLGRGSYPFQQPENGTLARTMDIPLNTTFFLGFRTNQDQHGFVQLHWESANNNDYIVADGWALWDSDAQGPYIAFDVNEGPVVEPVYCVSDFDQDGTVDLGDFGVFGAAYGSTDADPHYNEACDFDNDGDVDLGDFGVFGQQFANTSEDCAG